MGNTNIQIKHHNGTSWDDLFPKTKASITLLNDGSTVETTVLNILTSLASKVTLNQVNAEITKVVGSAPVVLDTLKELADALDNDPNFAATITTQLGNKVVKETGKGLSTNDFTTILKTKLEGLKDYTAEISSINTNKADKSNTYTKTEVDTRMENLQGNAVPVSPTEPVGASVWFQEI